MLAQSVLAEVPGQVASFFKTMRLKPPHSDTPLPWPLGVGTLSMPAYMSMRHPVYAGMLWFVNTTDHPYKAIVHRLCVHFLTLLKYLMWRLYTSQCDSSARIVRTYGHLLFDWSAQSAVFIYIIMTWIKVIGATSYQSFYKRVELFTCAHVYAHNEAYVYIMAPNTMD